ncbi:anti-sigma factor antagonist [bacterium]|nr:anti-sigma factor antagonist [bacterium]MCK4326793.1 anti-sigma factor antagonist [bacterium]MCK4436450.1 anti-sigma factor antagonist [bacterium]
MGFKIDIRKDLVHSEKVSLIQVGGYVDTSNFVRLKRVIEGQIKQGKSYIILYCKELEYISSAGIGVLKSIGNKLQNMGGDLTLVSLTPKVKKVIELIGLQHLIKIYDDLKQVESALKRERKEADRAVLAERAPRHRKKLTIVARKRSLLKKTLIRAVMSDISLSGMKIVADEDIGKGEKIEATIYPPGVAPKDIALSSDKPIVIQTNVVGSEQVETDKGRANRLFLQFVNLSQEDTKKLDEWLWA